MRSALVSQWLAMTPWSRWHRTSMTGDASARRYERLAGPDGSSLILMDAPPETCGSQSRFVEIANHLNALGLAAPDVLDWNDASGLMVISDLGRQDFAKHLIANPSDEAKLYGAAVEILQAIQSSPPPDGLVRMTPQVGADMIGIAFEWAAVDDSHDLADDITSQVRDLLQDVDPNPSVLSLRDFHAENLIWRPSEQELLRVGLLDFQDAFVTHPTYDLASLLRDARRDVDPSLLDPLIAQLADENGDIAGFKRAFHVMAVQRNLRILGIFHRLARQSGKTGYLALIPRVWAHLQTDLATSDFAKLQPLIGRAFGSMDAQT